jgi:hypothetical protein
MSVHAVAAVVVYVVERAPYGFVVENIEVLVKFYVVDEFSGRVFLGMSERAIIALMD